MGGRGRGHYETSSSMDSESQLTEEKFIRAEDFQWEAFWEANQNSFHLNKENKKMSL